MSAIVQYNGSDDQFAEIDNTSTCRSIPIGSSWTSLRIGVRWCISGSDYADVVNNPRTAMGLSHGNAEFFNTSSTANHFVGLWGQDSTDVNGYPQRYPWASWTWSNVWGIANVNTWKVENGNLTLINQSFTNLYEPLVTKYPNRCYTLLEFIRGSPNWTITSFHYVQGTQDMNIQDLYNWCHNIPVFLSFYSSTTPGLIFVDEGTYGLLDTFCFYWNSTSHKARISDIMIVPFI